MNTSILPPSPQSTQPPGQLQGVLFDAFEQDGSYFVSTYGAGEKPEVTAVSRQVYLDTIGRCENIVAYREWGYVSFDVAAQVSQREN